MATPFTAATKSLHEQAIECVIQATDAAMCNQQEQCKMFIQQAKMYGDSIARKMRAMGMHRQADEYLKSLNEHINRVWIIAQRKYSSEAREKIEKARSARGKLRKSMGNCEGCGAHKCEKTDGSCKCMEKEGSHACACGYADTVKKSNPFVSGSAKKEYHSRETLDQTKMKVGGPKTNPRHEYKMIHELSPAQQEDIQHKFPQGGHSQYAYPVHRDTGELVHGQRIPLSPHQVVQAHHHAFRELRPEHQKGSFVQIHAPGHSAHGKKGVVLGPNPNVPGKVGVQIGHTAAHSIYVDPHQVRPSKASSKVEKAIQTLFNIRKAFMKE